VSNRTQELHTSIAPTRPKLKAEGSLLGFRIVDVLEVPCVPSFATKIVSRSALPIVYLLLCVVLPYRSLYWEALRYLPYLTLMIMPRHARVGFYLMCLCSSGDGLMKCIISALRTSGFTS